ncbi:hypothetical protein BDZ85DRAFT_113764 [Elsinoe ampelina]|uniref:Cora-like Mg2+ transporter protein-domain-containing protein n=1 Tax=Elsinoe ampelina TaxID=302913 RepID=A0A6A6GDH5_9PEZI|nr:hypothetical protein BDZ85DRAFT_113764 [Elsinoe ampelina]
MRELERRLALSQSFWTRGSGHYRISGYFGADSPPSNIKGTFTYTSEAHFLWKRSMLSSSLQSPGIEWISMGVFVHWDSDGHTSILLECEEVEATNYLIKELSNRLAKDSCQADPYASQALILELMVGFYATNVDVWLGFVRSFEARRQYGLDVSGEQTYSIDDLPRHLNHCTECLEVTVGVVESMIEEHTALLADCNDLEQLDPVVHRRTSQSLRKCRSLFRSLVLQARSLESRMRHEAELDRTFIARQDSRTAANIAALARADSSSTKTISVLGLIFLPTTLVCSIFSTTFFTLQPAAQLGDISTRPPFGSTTRNGVTLYWIVSDQFWLLWLVSIPLTLLTVLCWALFTGVKLPSVSRLANTATRRPGRTISFNTWEKGTPKNAK